MNKSLARVKIWTICCVSAVVAAVLRFFRVFWLCIMVTFFLRMAVSGIYILLDQMLRMQGPRVFGGILIAFLERTSQLFVDHIHDDVLPGT